MWESLTVLARGESHLRVYSITTATISSVQNYVMVMTFTFLPAACLEPQVSTKIHRLLVIYMKYIQVDVVAILGTEFEFSRLWKREIACIVTRTFYQILLA